MPRQHKKSKCTVCEKWLRSDNFGRHMKIHKDLLDLPDEEVEEELKVRHEKKLVKEAKEEKRQQIVTVAQNLGVSVPEELQDRLVKKEETLHQRLINNKNVYMERVRIGEQISKYLIDDAIPEESLNKDDKLCLDDLYRKHEICLNIRKVELRPWQKDAFQLFDEPPNDQKVIWI